MARLDLRGTWQLCQANEATATPLPAQVPGDTHSALLAAGRIPDPYWGTQELDVQWVGRQDWTYRRSFSVDAAFLAHRTVFLNCDVLDTIAEVTVNGRRVGTSENMFVRFRAEVKRHLHAGENELVIRFRSAEQAAIAAARKLPYPVPCGGAPVESPHRNLIRKVPCHAGWDWGCCLMVAGLGGEVYLEAANTGRIEHVTTVQRHHDGEVEVEITVEHLAPVASNITWSVMLGDIRITQPARLERGLNWLTATVTIVTPQLWWPNGYGEQPLYPLTVTVGDAHASKRIGLRTLEVLSPEDKHGKALVVRVNGLDIFCKGANWIPADALPQRQTRAVFTDLLTSARMAHMNMLRVWGGGQYESEEFYDLCDELGLLVWQDFMFSCSLYPATPAFLDNVRAEAEYQVKRLRDHACIAIWCGNNENVGALTWFKESRENRDRYLVDYDRLNEGVLGQAVDACDPTRPFWPSSPCGGRNDYSDCWHQDNRGDMHFWSVWHEGKSFDAFYTVKPRFCSEFGYQSFPSLATIRSYAPADQFNVTSPVMEHHQRNSRGNSLITEMFTRYFRVPEGFANFVYLSQVQQALAIKTAVEHWRRLRPVCMGTLFWQLNDNWPVCSWASIEYGGRWKLLHYAARRFYAPTLLSLLPDGKEQLELWVTNDLPRAREGVLTVRVLDFAGKVHLAESWPVAIPASGAVCGKRLAISALTTQPEQHFLVASLTVEGETQQQEHFFALYKRCSPQPAQLTAAVTLAGTDLVVTLSTDRPAFFVALTTERLGGIFSDNFFTLLPGEPRRLVFTPAQPTTVAQLQAELQLCHLRQTYA